MVSCWSAPSYKDAYNIAILGCLLEGCFSLAGIAGYIALDSSLCLVYGLENWVDFASSAIVLWRFWAPAGAIAPERRAILEGREERAGVAISTIIILLGMFIVSAAGKELRADDKDSMKEDDGFQILVITSLVSVVIFSFMTVLKLRYARLLQSDAMRKDGICSLIGVALSAAIVVNAWAQRRQPDLWSYDAAFALFCGVVAMLVGIHGVGSAAFQQGLPIHKASWWWRHGVVGPGPAKDSNIAVTGEAEGDTATTFSADLV